MPKKGKTNRDQLPLTKRQFSHWQSLRRRQVIYLFAGSFAVLAVVVLMAVGWFLTFYQPMHQVVVRVNETEFNMEYFIDMLKLESQGQQADYIQQIAQNLPTVIEHNEIIRQAAAGLGITVSDDEVNKQIKDAGFPNDAAHRDIVRTQLLVNKLKSDYFDKQLPAEDAQVNIQAMLLESESQANQVRDRIENGEKFSDLAKDLSLNDYTKTNSGNVTWHPQDMIKQLLGSSVPGDYAFGSEAGTLSQPRLDQDVTKSVGYWIIKVNNKDNVEQTDVSLILVGSREEGDAVRTRLQNGEDFATVAKDVSQLDGAENNGGNMGPSNVNALPQAIQDYINNPGTKNGDLSDPIKDTSTSTRGGYWLINVIDKSDSRIISSADRDFLNSQALNDWATNLWLDPSYNAHDFLDNARLEYAIQKVIGS